MPSTLRTRAPLAGPCHPYAHAPALQGGKRAGGGRLNDLSSTDASGTASVGQMVVGESTAARSYDTLIDDVSVDTK
jgi:hypothetical protein